MADVAKRIVMDRIMRSVFVAVVLSSFVGLPAARANAEVFMLSNADQSLQWS
jgi:hypothetical protein